MKRGSERGSFRASGAIVAAACDDGASYLIGKFRQSPLSLSLIQHSTPIHGHGRRRRRIDRNTERARGREGIFFERVSFIHTQSSDSTWERQSRIWPV